MSEQNNMNKGKVRIDFPPKWVAAEKANGEPYTISNGKGDSWPAVKCTLPTGTKVDGKDLSGFNFTTFQKPWNKADIEAGEGTGVFVNADRNVSLFKYDQDGQRHDESVEPQKLSDAVEAARAETSDGQRIGVAMPEVKPSISELYESGGLDMWLVNKIAHNELDKSKGPLFNSVYALASEYIDAYIDDHPEVIETYTDMLDSELTATDFEGGRISPEFMLGAAIARGAASHASCDIENFGDEISSRAINEINELSMAQVRFDCRKADDFSLAGVNPGSKFPIGFVSVQDVADTVNELGSEHMKETLKPADLEKVAVSLAEAEQCIERDDLAAGIAFNAGLEMGHIEGKRGEQGLDDICAAKSEEADLISDGDDVELDETSHEK